MFMIKINLIEDTTQLIKYFGNDFRDDKSNKKNLCFNIFLSSA